MYTDCCFASIVLFVVRPNTGGLRRSRGASGGYVCPRPAGATRWRTGAPWAPRQVLSLIAGGVCLSLPDCAPSFASSHFCGYSVCGWSSYACSDESDLAALQATFDTTTRRSQTTSVSVLVVRLALSSFDVGYTQPFPRHLWMAVNTLMLVWLSVSVPIENPSFGVR